MEVSFLMLCTLGWYSFWCSHVHNNYCLKYKQAYSTWRKYKLKKKSLNNKQLMCFCLHTSTYAQIHLCTHTQTYTHKHTHTRTPTRRSITTSHGFMECGYISQFQKNWGACMLLRITLSPSRLFTQQEWEDIQNTSRDHVLLLCNSNFLRDLHIHKPMSCVWTILSWT